MKKTSIKSFAEITTDGTITKKEGEVLDILKNHLGTATAREIGFYVTGAWKRMAALQDKGLVCVVGTTKDNITNKIVSVYAATDNQPMLISKTKRPTRKELEAEIVRLSKELDRGVEKAAALYDLAYMAGYSDAMGRECMPEDK